MKLWQWQEAMRKANGQEVVPLYWACLSCGVEGTGRMPDTHKHETKPLGQVTAVDLARGIVTVTGS